MSIADRAPLQCQAGCTHGLVPTYTRTAPSWFSDALGPTVDGPCAHCSGSGLEPCALCTDQPATSTVASRPVCDDCAPFVRRTVAETIPAPADDIVVHGANDDGSTVHADCRMCNASRGFARAF